MRALIGKRSLSLVVGAVLLFGLGGCVGYVGVADPYYNGYYGGCYYGDCYPYRASGYYGGYGNYRKYYGKGYGGGSYYGSGGTYISSAKKK